MPTDAIYGKGTNVCADNHDISIELQGDPPEQSALPHASSSQSISSTRRSNDRLATYEEIDETEEGILAAEAKVETKGLAADSSPSQKPGSRSETSNGGLNISGATSITQEFINATAEYGGDGPPDTQDHTSADKQKSTENDKAADGTDSPVKCHVGSVNGTRLEQGPSTGDGQSEAVASESTEITSTAEVKVNTSKGIIVSATEQSGPPEKKSGIFSRLKAGRPRSAKPSSAKQGRQSSARDADQKPAKRISTETTSRSPKPAEPRIPRNLMERHLKKTEKSPMGEDKSRGKNNNNYTSVGEAKAKTNEALPTVTNNVAIKADVNSNPVPTPQTVSHGVKQPESTAISATAASDPKQQHADIKPLNGVVQTGGGRGKDKEPGGKQSKKDEKEEQQESHTLLNTAVIRRLNAMDNNVATPLAELNSSAGAKSLSGSLAGTSLPHSTHMQSLTVPSSVVGSLSPEADDKVSVGSRRDSVRQSLDSVSRKSVDYRLLTANAVITVPGVEDKARSLAMHDDSMMRAAIPAMSVRLAVVCLVLNIVLPGCGTIVSGLSVLCGSKSRLPNKTDSKGTVVCINLCVGAAQLGTISFLFVGWFWSLAWGVKMVILAVEHRTEQRQQREKELQTLALRAFGSPANLRRSLLPPV